MCNYDNGSHFFDKSVAVSFHMMNVYNKLFIQGDMGRRAKFTGARISRFPPPRIISIALMYTSRG